ncbi:MAG: MmcQ/YjbR family DNA-binding protein [Actinomycetota bacterium]|nr:MmcQ/YjbR family DNA-binding protein [Actinomycetota bacterium]
MDEFDQGLTWARSVCLPLPEVYEEPAWVGTRWRIRNNTFAHLLEIVGGYPASFATAAGTRGPATVLILRPSPDELAAVLAQEASFGPLWRRGDVGIRLDSSVDWDELAELVVESYRLRAPKKLLRLMDD